MESVDHQLEAILATGVQGAVAVAVWPDTRIEAAAGLADVRTREALTVDHRFRIGSVTKIFVAALVLQLVAEGLRRTSSHMRSWLSARTRVRPPQVMVSVARPLPQHLLSAFGAGFRLPS